MRSESIKNKKQQFKEIRIKNILKYNNKKQILNTGLPVIITSKQDKFLKAENKE